MVWALDSYKKRTFIYINYKFWFNIDFNSSKKIRKTISHYSHNKAVNKWLCKAEFLIFGISLTNWNEHNDSSQTIQWLKSKQI